jgi:ankyrin repeat protein
MPRLPILLIILSTVVACGGAHHAAHGAETDALFQAARAGNADTVKALLTSQKADVNATDDHGNTPLMEAARFGHDDVVRALLIARADVTVKNDQGQSALTLAAAGGHDQTAKLLTQAGAK